MFGLFKKKLSADCLNQKELAMSGNRADQLNAAGKYTEAEKGYREIIQTMESASVIEGYFLGKSVIGILLALVRAGRIEEAHKVWTAGDNTTEGMGVFMVENAGHQFAAEDTMLYLLICAYLHAYAGGEKGQKDVIHYLNGVNMCALNENEKYRRIAANHWFLDFLILSEFRSPNRFSGALEELYTRLGRADEHSILSLVKESADSVSFNQKGLAKFFPNPAIWETASGATEFHPDGTVSVV